MTCETCQGSGAKLVYVGDNGDQPAYDECPDCLAIRKCPGCGAFEPFKLVDSGLDLSLSCSKCDWSDES